MPLRVIALLLAFALLWSGVSTIEAPQFVAQPAPEQQHAIVLASDSGSGGAHDGSLDDHRLDELPAQAQGDSPPETPGLLPPPLTPRLHGGPLAQPRAIASVGLASPFLAGPLRPPCAAPLAG